ncbi:MAG: hypothetical protein EBQ80_01550 [Proteobacteria bacterium]|nr:hypothetical protein [Pseudomonadota bacterium]
MAGNTVADEYNAVLEAVQRLRDRSGPSSRVDRTLVAAAALVEAAQAAQKGDITSYLLARKQAFFALEWA